MFRRPAHLLRWTVAAVAVSGVLAVALPYLYINVVQDAPPATLSALDAGAPAPGAADGSTASSAPAAGEVVWQVGKGSQAGYRVEEVLAGQATTAVGRTDAVTGSLTATADRVTAGTFSVDLTAVTSDSDRRDAQFQSRIMETDRYPTAAFTLAEPFALGSLATGGTSTVRVTGDLALHGVTRSVTVPLTAVRAADQVTVSGQLPVTFADYGIDNPSIGGFVTTGDSGVIEVLLVLTRAG